MSDHDWSVLTSPVLEVIDKAAGNVAKRYNWSADDLVQDGNLLVTSLPDLLECARNEDDLGLLHYRLYHRLVDTIKTQVSRRSKQESYDERTAEVFDEGSNARPARIAIRTEVSSYTRELVESLMPAVWDPSYAYGLQAENAPDGDMPRGSTNKATGNTLAAHLADIRVGYELAPLSDNERKALLLTYGLDWLQKEIGYNLGVSQRTVSTYLYTGVGKVMAQLNGDDRLLLELLDAGDLAEVAA